MVSRTKASSGLVRDRFLRLGQGARQGAGLGRHDRRRGDPDRSNDRQPLRDNGTTYDLDTDARRAAYVKRVDGMLAQLKAKGIKTVWVGFAADAQPKPQRRHGVVQRDLSRALRGGGLHLCRHLADSFVNDDGDYAVSGPDLNGQITKLRLGDGVHFKAGAQVAAHHVERELRRVLNGRRRAASPAADRPARPHRQGGAGGSRAPVPGAALEAPEPEKPEFGPVQPLDRNEVTAARGGLSAVARPGNRSPPLPATAPRALSRRTVDPSAARVLLRGEALAPKEGRCRRYPLAAPAAGRWPPVGKLARRAVGGAGRRGSTRGRGTQPGALLALYVRNRVEETALRPRVDTSQSPTGAFRIATPRAISGAAMPRDLAVRCGVAFAARLIRPGTAFRPLVETLPTDSLGLTVPGAAFACPDVRCRAASRGATAALAHARPPAGAPLPS